MTIGAGLAASMLVPLAASAQAAPDETSLPSGRTTYRNINDYNNEMAALAQAHPNLVKSIKLPYQTRQGRDVYGLEITHNVKASDGKPVFFMQGIHHGNEWPSGEHSLEFAYDIVKNDGVNPEITALLDSSRVIVVPVVNVDGFMINRRTSCGLSPTCASSGGVDLNRNYPFGWGSGAGATAVQRGPAPGSEPEVKNIMDLTTGHQVTVLVTNHTSGHTVLRPPLEVRAGNTPDEVRYAALSDAITAANGYVGMKSGFDYETTGETPDWSYYATRGFGFTYEIMKTQSTNNTYPEVIEDYLGTGRYAGKSNREAFMVAWRYSADAANHSLIKGNAPRGAVLKITKDFDLWTAPVKAATGNTFGPAERVPTHLESTLVVPSSGSFTWHVNPSVRPQPAYTENGVVATGEGKFLQESWKLTCSKPTGEVLQTVDVLVDFGQQANVNLSECFSKFGTGPDGAAYEVITADVAGAPLSLSVPSSVVAMPNVTLNGFDQIVSGALNSVTVVDPRGTGAGWNLTGQVSDFVGPNGLIVANNLGWVPSASVVPGSLPVAPGTASVVAPGPTAVPGTGLGDARGLCSAAAGASAGAFTCGASLNLGVPGSTRLGTYTGVLTLTLV
jgi:hypothetical protein